MTYRDIQEFVRRRNDALLSLDKKKIRAFAEEYGIPLPREELVFWGSVHKAICNIETISEERKEASRDYLKHHGFKETIF